MVHARVGLRELAAVREFVRSERRTARGRLSAAPAGARVGAPTDQRASSAHGPTITVSGFCPRAAASRSASICSRTVSGIWARSDGQRSAGSCERRRRRRPPRARSRRRAPSEAVVVGWRERDERSRASERHGRAVQQVLHVEAFGE